MNQGVNKGEKGLNLCDNVSTSISQLMLTKGEDIFPAISSETFKKFAMIASFEKYYKRINVGRSQAKTAVFLHGKISHENNLCSSYITQVDT